MASTEKALRNNKNQNIQVFVRLRPLNQRERAIRSLGVVDVINNREVVVRQSAQTSHTKKFTFDRAFAPNTEQIEVYKEVVSPLIAEVLAGYNCTVFAYGQTGTGKTHTMVGESTSEGTTWQNDPLSGIIPRALSQLFDELRISNAEYTVRVSYLELYNEELFDLLSSTDDNSKLRIYEDVTRKGSTIVNGLEEITVYNKNEVYEIMAQGQERKKVASTLMNAQSSRSHTVFTIVVHMKENCPKGEELVKIGKLNLVDLAGSENISKAGSDNPAKRERARECVNINQSLLTLGRVITALVEKHPHIPYRESKLTRILQESLGGRTKTSIIATISPGHKDLEETMSTLEYAHRAKNIQNKPEVNQKLTKQAILKDFAEEIDKLKRELTASREKNGVYLPSDTYVEMQVKHDEQRREIQELLLKKRAMEDERERVEAVFSEMEQRCNRTEDELSGTKEELQRTKSRLAETEQQYLEQEHLVVRHVQTEEQLGAQARQLVSAADAAASDAASLHHTVERRKSVESTNQEVVSSYREQSSAHREQMLSAAQHCADTFMSIREHMQAAIDDHARDGSMTQEAAVQDMKLLVAQMAMFMSEIKSMQEQSETRLTSAETECRNQLEDVSAARRGALRDVLARLVGAAAAGVARAGAADAPATVARAADEWLTDATARVQCAQQCHSTHATAARSLAARREHGARQHHAERLARLRRRDEALRACLEELENDKKAIEERITQQMANIEADRKETEERLQWMEEESRSLEERLKRMTEHVAEQRAALDARLRRHAAELRGHREVLAEAAARQARVQELQLEATREETEIANEFLEQCASERDECLKSLDEFEKEFGEDTHAISAEMEAFRCSVGQLVEHTHELVMRELRGSHAAVQQGAEELLRCDAETSARCGAAARAAVGAAASAARGGLGAVLSKVEETCTSTTATLATNQSRAEQLAGSLLEHQSAQSSSLARAAQCVERLGQGVRDGLQRQAAEEGRYLMREYRVYSPTGNTPARREYCYPRRLASTSPHERILARFRQQPAARARTTGSPESDCIVVESDEGRHTSDSDVSESSVSEDSAVAMQ